MDRFAVVLVVGLLMSGCSWGPRTRPVRDREVLQLQSAVVPAPAGPGWKVARTFDVPVRGFELVHAVDGRARDRWIEISEQDGRTVLPSGEAVLAQLSAEARSKLGDPAAAIEALDASPPRTFGGAAVAVAIRAEETAAKAGLLQKRVVHSALIAFVPPAAPDRACVIAYTALDTGGLPHDGFAESWRTLVDGVELRPASAANVAAAARADDFPKRFEPGLARRSLTLPAGGFQWWVARERWLAHGGFTGGWGLALGITDRLEVGAPGSLRLSFGEVEALERPELAVEAGLVGIEHDADRGTVWSYGVSAMGRKRLAPDVALRGRLAAYGAHESRTARDRPGGAASAEIVWDVLEYATLGLEAGWHTIPSPGPDRTRVWIGAGPAVTLHLPFVDLAVMSAAGWHDGRPGVRVGAGFLLTL
ncbi:hypothetical protein ACOQFB_13200 [Anaeromyxobacter sp. Red801]|uniref:hypothetical protein n=1 Tax=Anaeromyxobacter sp. Red801 TaxID=3411632 RepID=UPI003BA054DA